MSMLQFFRQSNAGEVNRPAVVEKNDLYNLDQLFAIGGSHYVSQILAIFLRDGTSSMQALKDALQKKDAASVMAHAHKLKSSAGVIKALKLASLLERTEQVAYAGVCSTELEGLVRDCCDTYNALHPSLQSLLQALKSNR